MKKMLFSAIMLMFVASLLLSTQTLSGGAAPADFDKTERDYYDWPDVLGVGETWLMKPTDVYFKSGKLVAREELAGGTWKYVSLNEAVVKVLNGRTLQGVGAGKTSLRLEITEKKTVGNTTTTTTTKWTTTKTISVASKQFKVAERLQRTAADIRTKYLAYRPLYNGAPFVSAPRIQSPFATGKLAAGYLQDGLNMTNFIRYLAGLPDNLELDDSLNEQAQHGAVLNAFWDELDHTPKRPSAMTTAFYNVAYKSTSSSNLSYGMETLHGQVRGFMDDLGLNNVAEVGHRRWILNPGLKKIGFGMAKSAKNEFYGTMQVFDDSGNTGNKVEYESISWPAPGFFPAGFFDKDACWSVSLNPTMFDSGKTDNIQVTLRKDNGPSWVLDANDNRASESGEYFNISKAGLGIPFAVVFRPEGATYEAGDTYTVRVTGLVSRKSGATTLEYQVKFFDLEGGGQQALDFPSTAEVKRQTARNEILIFINGRQKIYDRPPFKVNASVVVPLRGILENLGATIAFNNATQTITATKGTRKVVLRVGQSRATVDGRNVTLSQAALSREGRVYVPLRFVGEAFQAQVNWQSRTNTVVITLAK